MRAELLKMRALPTPRWTLAACLACTAIALVVTAFAGVGEDEDVAIGLGVELPTAVASIVLGAWIVGLEYGSATMRRTLTADPRRVRLFRAKAGVALMAALALTLLCFVIFALVFPPLAGDETDRGTLDVMGIFLAAVPGNAVACVVAALIALLTRSMGGGVTAALIFILVLDTALGAIPTVGDYVLSSAGYDIYQAIRDEGDPEVVRAVLVTFAWLAVLSVVGVGRFARSDV